MHARAGGAIGRDGADLREVGAGVVVPGGLALCGGDGPQAPGGVVAETECVAGRVLAGQQSPCAARGLVALGHAGAAVAPLQLRIGGEPGDGVVGAAAIRAHVHALRGVVGVTGDRAVAIGALDGAAGGGDRAVHHERLQEIAARPVVAVFVVVQPLAVVRADRCDIEPTRGEEVVLRLQDEIAVGDVDVCRRATAPLRGLPRDALLSERRQGREVEAQAVAADDRYHLPAPEGSWIKRRALRRRRGSRFAEYIRRNRVGV